MSKPLERLVHELAKLPSVGEKTALRLALHILRQPPEYGLGLAEALQNIIGQIRFCESCHNLSTKNHCDICQDPTRDETVICVVEDIADLQAVERAKSYRGHYHVLHGALSPLDGIGPDDLRIRELLERLQNNEAIHEIILATNPNVNGDATALYLSRLLKNSVVKLTKLASGLPIGGQIEYIDQNTLSQAFQSRFHFDQISKT